MEIITPEIVKNALKSFGPLKSPGPDEYRPKILQNLGEKAIKLLVEIYRESIKRGKIPEKMLKMGVIFIPKDKPDKSCPKSYRPITLSSFLLKGLERLIQWYLQETILNKPLYRQYAYTKGRSCDSALSEVIHYIERGFAHKKYTLAVSLDCSGAFDNITFESSLRGLANNGASPNIIKWYSNYLSGRSVTSSFHGESKTIYPTKGSPQGGSYPPWYGT